MQRRIAVLGLGYVGLPLAEGFARRVVGTLGFDIDPQRVAEIAAGRDSRRLLDPEVLRSGRLRLSSDPGDLADADFYVVAVPTPVDAARRPDLSALRAATRLVGSALHKGDVVVYESTVYPGVTEEVCAPILEEVSGLHCDRDFGLAYSPERINPGDREHTLETVVKVIAARDAATLAVVHEVYSQVVRAGLHRAPCIRVAEAAKVIENTQRDLNIALMNELAIIFQRLGIDSRAVLEAARTKWNFLPFEPGLVGGHCIGVDPFYLTAAAEAAGYHPEVILAGRRINDGMGEYVARQTLRLIWATAGRRGVEAAGPAGPRVGVLGVTFKEDVPDLRNSRVPELVAELERFGARALVHDPVADPQEARAAFGERLVGWTDLRDLSALVLAVRHRELVSRPAAELLAPLAGAGVLVDVKAVVDPAVVPTGVLHWRL